MPHSSIDNGYQSEISNNYAAQNQNVAARTDKLFAVIMLLQFIGCVIAAIVVTPSTWVGATSNLHTHVWAACIFGAVLAIPPAVWGCESTGRFK